MSIPLRYSSLKKISICDYIIIKERYAVGIVWDMMSFLLALSEYNI